MRSRHAATSGPSVSAPFPGSSMASASAAQREIASVASGLLGIAKGASGMRPSETTASGRQTGSSGTRATPKAVA